MSLREELIRRIVEIEGVETRKSRFADREGYYAGRHEIAHFHSGTEIDLRITRKRLKEMADDVAADPRLVPRPRASDWIAYRFRRTADLDRAVELVTIAVSANA